MVFLIPDVGAMLVKKQNVRGRSNFFSGSNQRGDPVCHSRTPRDAAPQRDYHRCRTDPPMQRSSTSHSEIMTSLWTPRRLFQVGDFGVRSRYFWKVWTSALNEGNGRAPHLRRTARHHGIEMGERRWAPTICES